MPLFLIRSGSSVAIRAETENVTMDGFFCYVQELFSPGERLRFLLLLPAAGNRPQPLKMMCLKGTAEVVHMTADGTRCGMGCRLDGYRVLADSAFSTIEEILAALIQEECLDPEM